MLKKISAEVLGITEFDENIYLEQIDHLEILDWEITYIFKNGKKEKRIFARTEKERQEILLHGEQSRIKKGSPLSKMIYCAKCGATCIARTVYPKYGETFHTFSCPTPPDRCPTNVIKETTMMKLVCDVLGIVEFDKDVMKERIQRILMADNTVKFLFKDGHEEIRTYKELKAKRGKRKNAKRDNTNQTE